MTESIGRTQTKSRLTTRQVIAIAVGIAILAVLLGITLRYFLLGEEPPIRVRNGSMDIELCRGEWEDNGDGWSPPKNDKASGTFTVKVVSANGHVCDNGQTASGKEVSIMYSDGFEATFKSSGLFSHRTKVRPKDKLKHVSPPLLQYGNAGDGGFIVEVQVKNGGKPWSCTFKKADDLKEIIIYPAPGSVCP